MPYYSTSPDCFLTLSIDAFTRLLFLDNFGRRFGGGSLRWQLSLLIFDEIIEEFILFHLDLTFVESIIKI